RGRSPNGTLGARDERADDGRGGGSHFGANTIPPARFPTVTCAPPSLVERCSSCGTHHRAVPVLGSMSRMPRRIVLRHAIRRIVFQYVWRAAGSSRNTSSRATPGGGGGGPTKAGGRYPSRGRGRP